MISLTKSEQLEQLKLSAGILKKRRHKLEQMNADPTDSKWQQLLAEEHAFHAEADMLSLRVMSSQAVQAIQSEYPEKGRLFHYTTVAGLMGILGSPPEKGLSLWATAIRYLNDTSEFQLGLELAKEVAKELWVAEIDETRKRVFHAIHENIEKLDDPVFVISFSEQDDTLSQWRAYGGETGYSLGWDFDALKNQANQKQQQWLLAKCIYDQDTQRKAMTGFLLHYLDEILHPGGALRDLLELQPGLTEEMQFNAVILIMRATIRRYAAIFKHKGFQEEKEWRLISPWPLVSDEVMLAKTIEAFPEMHHEVHQAQGIKYRPGRSGIVPYVEFQLGAQHEAGSLLKSITVGPNQHPLLARDAVYSLCISRNVPIGHDLVSTSGTPYRSW
ncbi:hypothetical protein HNQ50_001406 [Silvimonas terrae]|uniref:DUF2971 domain-containing protein n=1 Tax=Silvimonas terrae TaxID=300266 RepID=A0A840RDL9_9NEIS|nr:DUF2971 domain-containing protein [Silvimonas terrae]MBB5190684.1 hypothetical protein [Silvimonas terrae]